MFLPLYDINPIKHLARPYVNYGLIAVTVVVFFVTGGVDMPAIEQSAVSFGLIPSVVNDIHALPPEAVLVPTAATYVTYAFLHANLIHLGGNMLFLWVFGDNIEDAVGHGRYLVFYLLCAAGGGLAHTLVNPESPIPLIGASGAVAGIVAAYLLLHPRVKLWVLVLGRIPLKLSATWVLGAWAGFQVLNVLLAVPGEDNIAWWAHVGGLVTGAALIVVMRRRGVPLFDKALPEAPRA
jgi:membrane associated rhomboid family serine protease